MESTGFGSDFKKRKALPDESSGTAAFEPKRYDCFNTAFRLCFFALYHGTFFNFMRRKRLPQTVPPPPTPQYKHANPNIDIEGSVALTLS
jgi:hypothetical protein